MRTRHSEDLINLINLINFGRPPRSLGLRWHSRQPHRASWPTWPTSV
jgi:hypothetical protein